MSFTRRIIDSARSGLNSVMDRIAADDTPLSHVEEISLEREHELRTAARAADPRKPRDNARAALASASSEARAEREKRAEKRARKVHAAREKRRKAAEKAQEEAFRKAREQAERAARASARQYQQYAGKSRSTGRSQGGKRRTGRSPFQGGGDKIAEYYKVLDLPVGAPFDEVKKSYRKLMRKYHPDRHVGNPKKQKAATELSMRVTQAYKELEDHLKGK